MADVHAPMHPPPSNHTTQNYFTRVLEDDIKAVIKPQYVDHIPKAVRGNVEEVLDGKDQRGIKQYLLDHLDLTQVGWRGGGGEELSAWREPAHFGRAGRRRA